MATAAASGRLTRTRRAGRAGLRAVWFSVRSQVMDRPTWLALGAITFLAAALRLIPWLAIYPLHHDEALYGTWARLIAAGRDPLLLTPWVDKPPFSLYLIAASFRLFGVSELTLRLPGMIAGLLTVWATYGLARRMNELTGSKPVRGPLAESGGLLHGAPNRLKPRIRNRQREFSELRTALLAATLLALSPFSVLFAPTAFTDPWLTLWLVAAAAAALTGQPLLVGLAAGLAVASKQQGVFVIPLALALLTVGRASTHAGHGVTADEDVAQSGGLCVHGRTQSSGSRYKAMFEAVGRHLRPIALAALGFALIFGPLTWWDSLRWHNRPSFWERSLDTYGGLGLAAPAAWPGRAAEWAEPLGYLFGAPVLSALILGLALLGGVTGPRPARILGLYTAGYLLLHLAVTFQPWDRYLLPILPLVCVLAAQGGITAARWLRDNASDRTRMNADERGGSEGSALIRARLRPLQVVLVSAAIALAALMAHAAWLGAAGRIPVGSDYGSYRGVDRAAAALATLPADTIIYHRSLGWHLDFYLFNAPQERRWYDGAQKLADDAGRTARTEPGRLQWLVLPVWETPDVAALQAALAGEGLRLVARDRIRRDDGQPAFTLYQVAAIVEREGG